LLDAASCSSGALHVRVCAVEKDSGTVLEVVVDGVDQPAEKQLGIAGGSNVAAGVGPKLAVDGSHQLLKKLLQLSRDDICSLDVARAISVTVSRDVVQQLLQRWRQSCLGALKVARIIKRVRCHENLMGISLGTLISIAACTA
jgi:hypothetical protein